MEGERFHSDFPSPSKSTAKKHNANTPFFKYFLFLLVKRKKSSLWQQALFDRTVLSSTVPPGQC